MKMFIKKLALYLTLITVVNVIFGFFYEMQIRESIANKTHNKYVKYHDVHDPKNSYEIIFLGSSKGFCAYNPLIFDSILDTRSYNMCTGSQNTIESYYILRDILPIQQPKYIIYDMYLPSFEKRNLYYHILSNASFFNSPALEAELIIRGFGIEGILNYFTPILRHKDYVKQNIDKLLLPNVSEKEVKKEKWISGYLSNDYVINAAKIEELKPIQPFSNKYSSKKKIDYFKQLIELCSEKNIELICVRAPYPPSRTKNGWEDTASEFFQSLCEEMNVKFFDFNRIDDVNFAYKDIDFSDGHHLNIRGATKVSKQLSAILKEGASP